MSTMQNETISGFDLIRPATCPDFRRIVAPLAEQCWPEFMLHDPVADRFWDNLFTRFSDYVYGLLDVSNNTAVAMAQSVPLRWDGDLSDLPEEGWDWAFEQAVANAISGEVPNIQCAIQIAIHPSYRALGLSSELVGVMASIGRSKGFRNLIAPVRPSQKADYPLADIDRYIRWTTTNGLPFDAWLRVHARAGASILRVCHKSMVIQGAVGEWESWTGMRFPESGPYVVPGALNPVHLNIDADQGTYVEPNVWMVHKLS